MLKLVLTYADGDQTITKFNGTQKQAVEHYQLNNLLNDFPDARIAEVFFLDSGVRYTMPKISDKPKNEDWF